MQSYEARQSWHLGLPGWHGHTSGPFVHTVVPCFDLLVEANLFQAVCDDSTTFGAELGELIANANEILFQSDKSNQALVDGSKSVAKTALFDVGCRDLFLRTSRRHSSVDSFLGSANLSLDRIEGSRYGTIGIDVVDLSVESLESSSNDRSHLAGFDEVGMESTKILVGEGPETVRISLVPTSEHQHTRAPGLEGLFPWTPYC
jgi:hypothetical protein